MSAPAPVETPRLARVITAIAARFAPAEADAIARFARALFGKDGEVYLEQLGEDDATALTAHAYRFLVAGGPLPRVRAFTPRFASEGWENEATILETVLPDRPFIVDTVREYLRAEDVEIRRLLHPLIATARAAAPGPQAQGPLTAIHADPDAAPRESFVHAVVEPLAPARASAIEQGIAERLADVLLVTGDFAAMVARTESVVEALEGYLRGRAGWDEEVREVQEFLRWLIRGGCVFLGARTLSIDEHEGGPRLRVDPGSGLGLLRKEERSHYAAPTPLESVPPAIRSRIVGGPLLTVARTSAYAPVHRHTRMDYIGIKRLDGAGRVRGEWRFLGLLTSKAHAEESAETPILRRRLRQILQAERIVPGSHDHKEIVAIFNTMPKTELFAVPVEALRADIRTIMSMHRTSGVHVTFRSDALERGVAVMVILPRDKFSGELRVRLQEALAARFEGQVIDYHLALGEGDQARLHFFLVAPRARVQDVRRDVLQQEIAELARSWDDRLAERLVALHGELRGSELAERYARVLPAEYKASVGIATAVNDLRHLEALRTGAPTRIEIHNPVGLRAERYTAITLYLRGETLVLSDVMPVLENFGLRVFAADPITIPMLDGEPTALHTFFVQDAAGARLDVRRHAERLTTAILRVRAGEAENDVLNRLVLTADLDWREIALLRAYCGYAFQIGVAPSRRALTDALVRHPGPAGLLVGHFAARFDPARDRATQDPTREAFVASLDTVANIGEDRTLRALLDLVEATVRTNYYADFAAGGDHLALKIDCAEVDVMPRPRPRWEIYVRSPAMEGLHLRAGRLARGGIRFSDRHDDFRTEVLGLMKTQTVKNALIVPVGAKGGFIVKRGLERPEAVAEAYAMLIRGMLALTDSVGPDGVHAPAGLVCHDEPDFYLVVAADKGTAAFSDLANGIAAEYRFWLGDAFAAGGSNGYDHKKLGITARGAWECVTLHFRELDGRDVGRDPIDAVGIGDMSGDVFGNGMLLSRTIRLRAAFDHRHIFLDPAPDPAVAFAERQRLFALPRSSWGDYDRAALGPGGMIVPRGAKSVAPTAEVRAMLGIAEATLDSERLIQAVLRMETDLLFNGGIGTYVKARGETHAEVGDGANVAVRVNADELRARVIGEGGNLGLTQRARVEFSLAGGRCNTDAIDNSAGVDMSDHEVNLKIALQPLLERGELSLAQRNRLLEEIADAVAALVLDHNRSQSRALSRDQRRSRTHLVEFREMMAQFEAEGLLDRTLEGLPDREALRARRASFHGLTRPELAVLLAYAKMHCTRAIAADELGDDVALERVLFSYFPAALVERLPEALRGHRLRHELIATTLTNLVVDLMGTTFLTRTARETGAAPADVVRALVVIEGLCDAHPLATACGAAPPEAEALLLEALIDAVARATRWLVETQPAAHPIAETIARFRAPVAAVLGALPPAEESRRVARRDALVAAAAPVELAERVVAVEWLREALDVVLVATAARVEPLAAAAAYWAVAEVIEVAWIRDALARAAGEDRWERRAVEVLGAELDGVRRALARQLLAGEGDLATRVAAFRLRRVRELARLRTVLDDLRGGRTISLAAVMVVVRELQRLEGVP